MGHKPPLNLEEKQQIVTLAAQGKTAHAIGKAIHRDEKTISKELRKPDTQLAVTDAQEILAAKYGELVHRILDAVTEEDIAKSSLRDKIIAAATATDKQRLISGQATSHVAIIAGAVRASWEEE